MSVKAILTSSQCVIKKFNNIDDMHCINVIYMYNSLVLFSFFSCVDGCTVFTDLSTDDSLFEGTGDYQFDMYRKMKELNK